MKKLIFLALCALSVQGIFAQTLQTNFHSPTPIRPAQINAMATQADGKLLVGGVINFMGAQQMKGIVRLNADGSHDNTFAPDISGDLNVLDIAIQSAGQILVLANPMLNTGKPDYFKWIIYKLSSTGELLGSIDNLVDATSLFVQTDGMVIAVAGGQLRRFDASLNPDPAFNNAVFFNGYVKDVAQFGNHLIVAGNFSVVNGVAKKSLVKLDLNGAIDNSFDTGTGSSDGIGSISIQPDGKIFLGDTYTNSFNGTTTHGLVRLNANGSLDNTFNPFFSNSVVSRVLINGNDFYVAALTYYNGGYADYIFKLSDNGSMDQSFQPVMLTSFGFFGLVATVTSDGIVMNNSLRSESTFGVSKADFAGNRLVNFAPATGRFGVFTMGAHVDDKFLIAGDFVKVDGLETYGAVRLNSDGTVDQAFSMKTNLGPGIQLEPLDDGSVLVSTWYYFVKLSTSGDPVPGFSWSPFKSLYGVGKFVVLPNGKIQVADANNTFRLNANGSEDTSFNIGSGVSGTVSTMFDIDVQSGKIIYGCAFSSYSTLTTNAIVRINTDGSPDATFDTGSGAAGGFNPTIGLVKTLSTNEMLIGGLFQSFDGVTVPGKMVKLSADGHVDPTFIANQLVAGSIDGNENYPLYNMVREFDSKVYITNREGYTPNIYIIKLDGSRVNNFVIPVPSAYVTDLITPPASEASMAEVNMFALGSFVVPNQANRAFIIKMSVNLDQASAQTITFNALSSKKFGNAPFDLTATASSGLGVSYSSTNELVATVSGSTVTIKGVGSTVITASQAGNTNFLAATSVPRTLVVEKANQTITFGTVDAHVFGDVGFELAATSTSGLPVTFTSSNELVATIIGSTVTVHGTGSATITAHQGGNANYNAATGVERALVINKAAQTITFGTIDPHVVGDLPFALTATSSSSLPVTFTSSNELVATISGSTVTVHGAGSATITAHQGGNANYNAATNVERTLVVTDEEPIPEELLEQTITFASLPARTVGDEPFSLSATSTSELAVQFTTVSDKISITGTQATIVKAGHATIVASQPGNDIYDSATPVEQTFCINPAKPVISNASTTGANTIQLTSSAEGGNQWYLDGTAITSATNKTFAPTISGSYSVKSSVDNCVSESSTAFVFTVTGLEDNFNGKVVFYPNPVSTVLHVDLSSFADSDVDVSIYDMMGRKMESSRANQSLEIGVSAYSSGMYVLELKRDEKVIRARFVREH